ncbi:hypothetical protein [Tahibacter amnicola]|uniref:Uncharacterized protein n=1 Tax=Tahibacter amnicola TaxID=2976241 RepID=A0ABY6BF45_9GAMM|nr:hypothetical protein [Tahibacter amnicola]UXI68137.1 hypothetical protein N4264_00345 [Tahibacter amnicola]
MLSTRYLAQPDITDAAREALINAERLRLGGYFAEAFQVAASLTRPGAWECPRGTQNFRRAASLLPTLAWLNDTFCPAVGDNPRRTPRELAAWAGGMARHNLDALVIAGRQQLQPAGTDWTQEGLDALNGEVCDGRVAPAVSEFLSELEWVLKARVRRALGLRPPEWLPVVARGVTPFHIGGGIRTAPAADGFHHRNLMEVLFRCIEHTGGGAYLPARCVLLTVILELHEGSHEGAADVLARWSPWLVAQSASDFLLQHWQPYVDMLRSRALASMLGLDDVVVANYMTTFRSRQESAPGTVSPAQDPPATARPRLSLVVG